MIGKLSVLLLLFIDLQLLLLLWFDDMISLSLELVTVSAIANTKPIPALPEPGESGRGESGLICGQWRAAPLNPKGRDSWAAAEPHSIRFLAPDKLENAVAMRYLRPIRGPTSRRHSSNCLPRIAQDLISR